DSTDVYGYVTLQWKTHPEFQKTFQITAADIKKTYYDPFLQALVTTKSDYFAATKNLTIPENEYVAVQLRWDLISDTGTDLRAQAFFADPGDPTRERTQDITMIVTSGTHLYAKSPMLYSEPWNFVFYMYHSLN
ncbi:MAG TPA: hypothetical protein VK470_14815, partial [Bacteroidota bacterium]|nr:hypothetical protein [Bacteroidota bacterium]